MKDMSKKISRILRPYGMKVAHRPMTTLRSVLTKVKDPTPAERRKGAIYKINCSKCQTSYIGETSRSLCTRIKGRKRCLLSRDRTNNIAVHHIKAEHSNDWENATCLAYRKTILNAFFWKVGRPMRKRIP